MAQILVVKPGTLTRADKNKLRASGVVSVEAESPQDVRLIGAEGPALDGNDLFFAAISAIAKDKFNGNTQEAFVKTVQGLLVDARAKAEDPA